MNQLSVGFGRGSPGGSRDDNDYSKDDENEVTMRSGVFGGYDQSQEGGSLNPSFRNSQSHINQF